MNPEIRKPKALSIITNIFLLIALLSVMAGCHSWNKTGHSIKAAATTPKGNYDFSKGKIYVTNQEKQTISMANLDGSGGVSLGSIHTFMFSPVEIVIDSLREKIYVSNASGTIIKANLDGSEGVDTRATYMTGEGWAVAMTYKLEIDPLFGKLYIYGLKSKKDDKRTYVKADDPAVIIQTNLDGNDKTFVVQDMLTKIDPESKDVGIAGIDAKNRAMYFLYQDSVIMGKMDTNEVITISKGIGGLIAIDPENEKIYWVSYKQDSDDSMTSNRIPEEAMQSRENLKKFVDSNNKSGKQYTPNILRTNLEGKELVNLGDLNGLMDDPVDIAIEPKTNKMYIVNWDSSTIIRSNLDGTGAENLGNLNGTVDHPRGIAVLPPGVVRKSQDSNK